MTKRIASLVLFAVTFFGLSLGFAQQAVVRSARVSGNFIALTFDDGPGERTPQLLDTLQRQGVHATFFVVGQMAKVRPQMVKRMVDEGHEVANHTLNHWLFSQMVTNPFTPQNSLPAYLARELNGTNEVIRSATNGDVTKTTLMRPPGGDLPQWAASLVGQAGYKVVLWSVDCGDTRKDPRTHNWPGKERIKQNILSHTRPGSIILAHDVKKATVDAMDETIAQLKQRGFEFVTVSELLAMENQPSQAPQPAPTIAPAPAAEPPPATITPPSTAAAPAPSSEPAHSLFTYVVRSGDNLGKICKRFKCDVGQVANQNGISDPSRIFVGQQLKIPQR